MDNDNLMDLAMALSMATVFSKAMGDVMASSIKQQFPGTVGEPHIFAIINGKKSGPYTLENIATFLNAGTIDNDTYVWQAGMNDWMRIKDILTLKK